MLPVANRPVLQHLILLLKSHGLTDIVVCGGESVNEIETYFRDGRLCGVRMDYIAEGSLLGTGGAIRNAAAHEDTTFLVVSGDIVTDLDFTGLIGFHHKRGAALTIALTRADEAGRFATVEVNSDGIVEAYWEKSVSATTQDTVDAGIYVMEPCLLPHIGSSETVSLSSEVIPRLLVDTHVTAVELPGYWRDIGTLDSYRQVQRDSLDAAIRLPMTGTRIGPQVWVGRNTEVSRAAVFQSPTLIGEKCLIDGTARLGPYAVIGDSCEVEAGAQVLDSLLLSGVRIGTESRISRSILGQRVAVGRRCACEGAAIGDDCVIGDGAVIEVGAIVSAKTRIRSGEIVGALPAAGRLRSLEPGGTPTHVIPEQG